LKQIEIFLTWPPK